MNCQLLPRVAFWLVPRRADRALLQALIGDLAAHFSAPLFLPHVTLYSCRRTAQMQEVAVMAALAASSRELVLRCEGLAGKDRLAQALYLKLSKSPAISALTQGLHANVPEPSGYLLQPHLSLLYQKLSPATRKALVAGISLSLGEVGFDELWAVAIPWQLREPADFRGWQPLLICRLASATIPDTIGK